MKLSLEFLGVGVVWLLGWSSKVGFARYILNSESLDNCIVRSDGEVLAFAAIEYDANPQCRLVVEKDSVSLYDNVHPMLIPWVREWSNVLRKASSGLSSHYLLVAMLNHCPMVSSARDDSCPFDLERESLSVALVRTMAYLKNVQLQIQYYTNKLKPITSKITHTQFTHLFKARSHEEFGGQIEIPLDVWTVRNMIRYILYFSNSLCNFEDLTENDIKVAVKAWKRIIEKPGSTEEILCTERQLKHFLYHVLRCQLLTSEFLNLPNTPIGKYYKFEIDRDVKKVLEYRASLNIPDIINNMSADAAASKIYDALNNDCLLNWQRAWNTQVKSLLNHFYKLNAYMNGQFDRYVIEPDVIKKWVTILDITAKQIEYILLELDILKVKLTDLSTASTNRSTSIHECVEYLSQAQPPTTSNRLKLASKPHSPHTEH
ncbi:hypothetical protein NEHOM01_0227 [Nematocida homosporus]|uniref:uncharacterized protein n=1 Tax=Nematocida homosporus TaxID=1912981 RepID=UPI00221F301D|nr:uncharacterized protein NEHOM01_0227 [Nematocida homosporus]KAI5184552.1 hypothetical protein NEHOM01_0227 [Nematocida homosporus]